MKKIISLTIVLFLSGISYAAEQAALSKADRIELEYYILKVRDLNNQIDLIATKRADYAKSYEKVYGDIMKKYNRGPEWSINLETGEFVKVEKKEETK